jgi:hypothetical protein
MSQHPAVSILLKMEDDLCDLEGWARALCDLGTVEIGCDPKGVRVIGRTLLLLSQRLDERWTAVRRAHGMQA